MARETSSIHVGIGRISTVIIEMIPIARATSPRSNGFDPFVSALSAIGKITLVYEILALREFL